MDPQEAINTMSACATDEDWITLAETAEDLIAWLDKGGFAPWHARGQLESVLDKCHTAQSREMVQACINALS